MENHRTCIFSHAYTLRHFNQVKYTAQSCRSWKPCEMDLSHNCSLHGGRSEKYAIILLLTRYLYWPIHRTESVCLWYCPWKVVRPLRSQETGQAIVSGDWVGYCGFRRMGRPLFFCLKKKVFIGQIHDYTLHQITRMHDPRQHTNISNIQSHLKYNYFTIQAIGVSGDWAGHWSLRRLGRPLSQETGQAIAVSWVWAGHCGLMSLGRPLRSHETGQAIVVSGSQDHRTICLLCGSCGRGRCRLHVP